MPFNTPEVIELTAASNSVGDDDLDIKELIADMSACNVCGCDSDSSVSANAATLTKAFVHVSIPIDVKTSSGINEVARVDAKASSNDGVGFWLIAICSTAEHICVRMSLRLLNSVGDKEQSAPPKPVLHEQTA